MMPSGGSLHHAPPAIELSGVSKVYGRGDEAVVAL